jgi:diacylglycerol O-acyltransferase
MVGSAVIRVRRLSGLDGLFLNIEMPGQPMQNLFLGLLRSPTGVPLTLEDLRRRLADRLDQLPAFRWRLVPVPLGLASSLLAEDPHFNLSAHLGHTVLPKPGGRQELDAACGRLVSRCLDRGRPMWRITLIDGLTDGRQALLFEVHHALMDGVAIRTTVTRIFSEEKPAGLPSPWRPSRLPGRAQLFAGALVHNARALIRLPDLISRTTRATRAVRERQARVREKVPGSNLGAPLSAINQGFTSERRFARASLPLPEVLAVKNAAGVTVNDVALALVGGALRRYLQARGALPGRPLVACVPVGMDETDATARAVGNRVTNLETSLATDIADPWERLQTISTVTSEAKVCLDLVGRELRADWLECIPPMLVVLMARRKEAARRRPGKRNVRLDSNIVVSNLRGPSVPWQLGRAIVEEAYVAPPGDGAGVNFAFWDYAGYLRFGILSFCDIIKNPAELAAHLSHCLDELVAAAEIRRVPTV